MTNPFTDETEATREDVLTGTDQDLDTDVEVLPAESDAEETLEEGTAEAPKSDEAKKQEKKSTRPPVPEGYISPVQFAKELTEHKRRQAVEAAEKAAEAKGEELTEAQREEIRKGVAEVRPQVVYSYIKNNGPGSKNPFPALTGDTEVDGKPIAPGRALVLKAEDGLAWWDAKDARVAASKAAQAEKAEKKAKKAEDKPADVVEAEAAEAEALVEAE